MRQENKLMISALFLVFAVGMVGCGPTADEMTATSIAETQAAASPTPTETLVPTATHTPEPTKTQRPTQTPGATNTLIPSSTPRPTTTPTLAADSSSSSGSGDFSSGCTAGGCHKFRVNNKTGETAYITLWGDTENYYFVVAPSNGLRFSILPGFYTIRLDFCGVSWSGTNALNSNWFVDLKCP